MKIAPSVLSCDFARLGEESAAMERAAAGLLHLDVMDGHFVPNITFGAPIIKCLRPYTKLPFDVHLMIANPLVYIDAFADAGADIITFHVEASSPVAETIAKIRAKGVKPGIVLKPNTPAEAAFDYLPDVDMVLVMTVEPGFGGQKFMADMLPKITALRDKARALNLELDIEVDGGIDVNTAPLVARAGANVLVAGSSLFSQKDYVKAVADLRAAGLSAL